MIRGLYWFRAAAVESKPRVQLLGAGAILGELLKAANILASLHGVAADVWSVTSFSEIAREGIECERRWRHGEAEPGTASVTTQLAPAEGPIVIATDYVRAVPEKIRAFLPSGRRCVTLGTDGFGRSDTRAALRTHFEVDVASIVGAALRLLG